MSDETPDQTPETPAEEVVTPPEGSETPDADKDAQKPDEGTETTKPKLTPEQLEKELSDTRREAANYRTKLREAEAKLAEAKSPEDIEAAIAEFRESNKALERQIVVTKVAAKYDLPPELAARLQGDDEAALEADAKSLAAFVNPKQITPETLSGGLTPGESDEPFDPVAAARKARKFRY